MQRDAHELHALKSTGGRLSYAQFIDALIVIANRLEATSQSGDTTDTQPSSLGDLPSLVDGMSDDADVI